uniref:Uncharacterized protein n=1 Tax=Heterorhabditis bacteriophora TaxID=37862 RepID=A0A1I7WS91_HETBA
MPSIQGTTINHPPGHGGYSYSLLLLIIL